MTLQRMVLFFVVLLAWVAAFAETYTINPKQGPLIDDMIKAVDLPTGWQITAIEIKKDHVELNIRSPHQKSIKLGLFYPSMVKNPLAKTKKFAIDSMPHENLKGMHPLISAISTALKARESAFQWTREGTKNSALNTDNKFLPLLLKARKMYAYGKKDKAIAILNRVVSQVKSPGIIAQAGRYFSKFGKNQAAKSAFQKATRMITKRLQQHPDDVHTIAEAISAYALMGKIKKAIRMYWQVITLHPEPLDNRSCLAARIKSPWHNEMILKFYYRVLKRFPKCKGVYLNAMLMAGRNKYFDKLDKLATQALKIWPNDQDILFTWGNVYHISGKFKRSSSIFIKLAGINPKYPSLLSLLGNSLINLDYSQEVMSELKSQSKLHPENLGWTYGLGALYYYRKEYKKAVPYLQKTVKQVPGAVRPTIYLALSEYWLGHKAKARKLLDAISNLAYKDPDILFYQAVVWSDKDIKRATAAMQKFVNILDNEPWRVHWGDKKALAHKILDALKRGDTVPLIEKGSASTASVKAKQMFWMWAIGIILLLVFGVWGYLLFRPAKKH